MYDPLDSIRRASVLEALVRGACEVSDERAIWQLGFKACNDLLGSGRIALAIGDLERDADVASMASLIGGEESEAPLRLRAGLASALGAPQVLVHAMVAPRDDDDLQALGLAGARSVLTAPLRDGQSVWGALFFAEDAGSARRADDLEALGLMAAVLASALCRVRMRRELHAARLVAANASLVWNENARLREDAQSARRAAEEASRAKSEYLAHVSHEIRTPLSGVIGMISLLQQTPLTVEQTEYVNTVRASGEALLVIINDVLDFSKIEARQIEFEERPFEVRHVVSDALRIVSAQARQRSIELRNEVHPSVPTHFQGDPFRVQQILVNLLSNAVKFTSQGYVRVAVTVDAPSAADAPSLLRFSIEDTGIGIPPDRLGRLFRPFSQADRSTARRYGGTGLGLAICRRLCELMGGWINVESRPGVGTTFTFAVSLRALDPETSRAAHPVHTPPTRPQRSNVRVLVAEDNAVNQRVAEMILRKSGFLVDVVSNGDEAVRAVGEQRYDVVLMDVQMPELDGLEATRQIVERLGDTRPKIVAMTASAMRGDRERCIAAGMDDYVDKPAKAADLVAAILRVLPEA